MFYSKVKKTISATDSEGDGPASGAALQQDPSVSSDPAESVPGQGHCGAVLSVLPVAFMWASKLATHLRDLT